MESDGRLRQIIHQLITHKDREYSEIVSYCLEKGYTDKDVHYAVRQLLNQGNIVTFIDFSKVPANDEEEMAPRNKIRSLYTIPGERTSVHRKID